jgi:hypothetical protein
MENEGNGVSEGLSNAIVEKLVDIGNQLNEVQDYVKRIMLLQKPAEKLLEGVEKMNKLAESGQGIIVGLALWQNKITEVKTAIEQHIEFFRQPSRKEVRHVHFVGWPFWVIVALVMVVGGVTACWIGAWQRASRHAANDVKWRYVKQRYELRKFTDSVEYWYRTNPKEMEDAAGD